MPRTKGSLNKRKSTRANRYKKTKSGYLIPYKFSKFQQPQLRSKFVKLRYCDNITLDPSSSETTGKVSALFACTEATNPALSGIGDFHQPLYMDQYTEMYQKYRVHKAVLTAKFINATAGHFFTQANPSHTYVVGVQLDETAGDHSQNLRTTLENTNQWSISQYRVVPPNRNSPTKLQMVYTPQKVFNIKDVNDNQGLTALTGQIGAAGTVPALDAYFRLWVASQDTNTNPPSMPITVCIDYFIEFFEPRDFQPEN